MNLTETGLHEALAGLRKDVLGVETTIPLLNGERRRYVFLDNAASTPTFGRVMKRVEEFLPWYAGVHRGMGFKAILATNVYDQTRRIAGRFVGACEPDHTVIFGKNTTESINVLAAHFHFTPDDLVIVSGMEHHSNDLPWRRFSRVIHIPTLADGSVDFMLLEDAFRVHAGRVRLVAITGASNVTGICNPIHEIARLAHNAGARIFVDAAQLVAHRPVNILPLSEPGHIDFIAYSAHKLYAPFGIGVLVGPTEFFATGEPSSVGGGTVSHVGFDEVEWAGLPQREEAGSPNVVGAVALAEAIRVLSAIGMDAIASHETELLEYAYVRLKKIPGVRLYGPTEDFSRKVGVIPFNIDGLDHALVATILSTEGGIGVRNGNFCAQPYVRNLLGVTPDEAKAQRAARCDNPILPGLVRASFGCYNNTEDVDLFLEMVERIVRRDFRGEYVLDPLSGLYLAKDIRSGRIVSSRPSATIGMVWKNRNEDFSH